MKLNNNPATNFVKKFVKDIHCHQKMMTSDYVRWLATPTDQMSTQLSKGNWQNCNLIKCTDHMHIPLKAEAFSSLLQELSSCATVRLKRQLSTRDIP